MDVGISTASYFNKLQIEDAALDLGARGVPLCEVFLNTYSEYEPEFVAVLDARLRAGKVRVYSVHPMSMQFEPQLFSIHARQREDAWRVFERVLSDGRTLGASHYVMHGPARLFGGVKNIHMERIAPIFRDLSALALEYGLRLTLENVSWCVFNEPEYGARLLDAVGPESLAFTLDFKQAVRSGHDPVEYVQAVGGHIVNVHLCGASPRPDGSVRYDMPGFGECDFLPLFSALAEAGYRGPAFIEVYSDMYDDIPVLFESLERVRRLAALFPPER